MINSHNVTKHACTSSWLPLAHSVHHTYHQVTVMDKQQKKQRLYTTHIYIYIYIYISCKCDTNRAGHFTFDAHASRHVACWRDELTRLRNHSSWHLILSTLSQSLRTALMTWRLGLCCSLDPPWSNTTYQPMREVVTTCVRFTLTHQGRVTHVMPLLVQMMACRLIIGKPLTKPVLTYY